MVNHATKARYPPWLVSPEKEPFYFSLHFYLSITVTPLTQRQEV